MSSAPELAVLDRLGTLYELESELDAVREVVAALPAVLVEASVSLRARQERELRLTLGLAPGPEDPDARWALVEAVSGLGAAQLAGAVDDALATLGATTPQRRLARGLALRVRAGEPARPRPGARVYGATEAERSARMAQAMGQLGLDDSAALHRRLAGRLAANPFNAVIPYGLAFDVAPERILGAKTYFACEWADVAVGLLQALADELQMQGVESFERLVAAAGEDDGRGRWLLEVSFEVPADPAAGVRAKAYVPAARLAANEEEGHAAVLRLARDLELDPGPYEELLAALRPDGLAPERPCSLMVGVSASAHGSSLEVYVFRRAAPAALSMGSRSTQLTATS
jgi:hypothetical protein